VVAGATGIAVLFVPPAYAIWIPPSLIGLWKLGSDLEKNDREKIASPIKGHKENGDFEIVKEIADLLRRNNEQNLALFNDPSLLKEWENVLPYFCGIADTCASSAAWRAELHPKDRENLRTVLIAYAQSLCVRSCKNSTRCGHRSLLRLCRALEVDPNSVCRRKWWRNDDLENGL
jgi:hypothetical protein